MAVLRTEVQWDKPADGMVPLTDVERITIRRGIDIKHNTLDVTLKNNPNYVRDYVSSGEITFKPEQQIDVYARYDDDGDGLDTSGVDDMIFSGRVVEFEVDANADSCKLKLQCSDSSFIALNKLWVGDETNTPPNLIVDVINRINLNVADPNKQIEATVGSGIASLRSNGSAFPSYRLSKVFKPAYEVINELSQPEVTGEIVPYRFHVDKDNVFQWFFPDDSAEHVLVEGATGPQSATYQHPVTTLPESVTDSHAHKITRHKLKKAVYDITNFIIFKAGEDMDNVQIMDFQYDTMTGSPVLKEAFRNWEDIARTLKDQEYRAGNLTHTKSDEYALVSTSGTATWKDSTGSAVTYSSASDYKSKFRTEVLRVAVARCQAIFNKTGKPRYKGTIEVKGANWYDPNDAVVFTSSRAGISNLFLRITEIQHNIDKNGWFTTLTVDEEIQDSEA